ncbi:MAG: DUF3667 domain-containing protein [Chryseobacterium sp.]|jgi:hypothetical protein|uniref:DUF3667 domain-containing protein n=1 Tax=Chryseobacterium sp. TaxID=1871047 RepID=UPI00281FD8CD|nr:DUF3667 domain-containing protein [Chryseobacterium sp.]MDR2237061.1 DUF3667 domain-containing protein [Chryseobacterium sp.]
MHKKKCLNCGRQIFDKYCANCGQKTSTGRITWHSLIKNDILSSIWHLDTRFLDTTRDILFMPGRTAIDYISGRRIRYYNFLSLLLILFSFNILGLHFYEKLASPQNLEEAPEIKNFFSEYSKAILFVIIPMLAVNTFFLFKKMKLNIAEHFIIGTVSLLGILIIFLLNDIVSLIGLWEPVANICDILDKALFYSCILFPAVTYWNAFKNLYSKWGLLWRTAVLYALMAGESLLFIKFYIEYLK